MRGAQHVACETPSLGQVVLGLLLEEGDALSLVAGHAVEPPRKQRHPFSQHRLEVSFRLKTLQHAAAMLFPILSLLHSRNDRSGGADAVAGSVPAHYFFACFAHGSSLDQTRTACTTRRTHAAPPLTRAPCMASSPARSQCQSAVRKAAGSLSRPAANIRSSHTSWAERSKASLSSADSSR